MSTARSLNNIYTYLQKGVVLQILKHLISYFSFSWVFFATFCEYTCGLSCQGLKREKSLKNILSDTKMSNNGPFYSCLLGGQAFLTGMRLRLTLLYMVQTLLLFKCELLCYHSNWILVSITRWLPLISQSPNQRLGN